MPQPHLDRFKTILVTSEATEGVDAIQALTPATRGPLAIEVISFRLNVQSTDLARQIIATDFDSLGVVPSQIAVGCEFEVELKGIGIGMDATTNKWRLDPLLRAGGMVPTFTVGPPKYATYNPTSDFRTFATTPTCSIWLQNDGLIYKMAGCRTNIAGVCGLENYPRLRITALGALAAIPTTPTINDGVMDWNFGATPQITGVTIQGSAVNPSPYMGIVLQAHTYNADITEISWDMNSQLQPRRTVQHPNGVSGVFIRSRGDLGVTGTLNPEATLRSDFDPWAKWRQGDVGIITTKFGTLFNEIEVKFPTAQFRQPAPGERDGINIFDLGFVARKSAGNDSWSLRVGSII